MIRSDIQAIYSNRTQLSAIIELVISAFTYQTEAHKYIATVNDYAILTDPEGIETKVLINTKQQPLLDVEIDGLFQMLGNPISIDESYSGEQLRLIAAALLYTTQNESLESGTTIYGLAPQNWSINEEYVLFKSTKSKK